MPRSTRHRSDRHPGRALAMSPAEGEPARAEEAADREFRLKNFAELKAWGESAESGAAAIDRLRLAFAEHPCLAGARVVHDAKWGRLEITPLLGPARKPEPGAPAPKAAQAIPWALEHVRDLLGQCHEWVGMTIDIAAGPSGSWIAGKLGLPKAAALLAAREEAQELAACFPDAPPRPESKRM